MPTKFQLSGPARKAARKTTQGLERFGSAMLKLHTPLHPTLAVAARGAKRLLKRTKKRSTKRR